jgi:hypothetical protein
VRSMTPLPFTAYKFLAVSSQAVQVASRRTPT